MSFDTYGRSPCAASGRAILLPMSDQWETPLDALGTYIRAQRKLAHLTLRELSDRAQVSNPYLSQIERGLHEPSVRVLRSIARALNISAESLLDQAGLLDDAAGVSEDSHADAPDAEAAIRADPHLSVEQKDALLSVYRTYRRANLA